MTTVTTVPGQGQGSLKRKKENNIHVWHYYDWNFVRHECLKQNIDSADNEYMLSFDDCEKKRHNFTVNCIDETHVSLTVSRECIKNRQDTMTSKRNELIEIIMKHEHTIKNLEKQFDSLTDNETEFLSQHEEICIKIGRLKFEISKIKKEMYTITYNKYIKEYVYRLPQGFECELIADPDENPDTCADVNVRRFNVILSWFNKVNFCCEGVKIYPSFVRIIETSKCAEKVALF